MSDSLLRREYAIPPGLFVLGALGVIWIAPTVALSMVHYEVPFLIQFPVTATLTVLTIWYLCAGYRSATFIEDDHIVLRTAFRATVVPWADVQAIEPRPDGRAASQERSGWSCCSTVSTARSMAIPRRCRG
jgi:hypothetical protein